MMFDDIMTVAGTWRDIRNMRRRMPSSHELKPRVRAIEWIRDGSIVTNPAHKPRARQFYSRVLNRYLWRVHAPSMYDGCGTTLDGALRVFRANNQLT